MRFQGVLLRLLKSILRASCLRCCLLVAFTVFLFFLHLLSFSLTPWPQHSLPPIRLTLPSSTILISCNIPECIFLDTPFPFFCLSQVDVALHPRRICHLVTPSLLRFFSSPSIPHPSFFSLLWSVLSTHLPSCFPC